MNLEQLRELAKPADIILTGGDGWLSKLIGFGQRTQTIDGKLSRWSHVMLYIDKAAVVESTMDFKPYPNTSTNPKRLDNGVQYNYLENHKDIPLAMLIQFPFTDEQRIAILNKAREIYNRGTTYPILGLIGSLLSYRFGWKSNPLQSKNSLYCSAFVQEAYSVIPIDFDPNHTARNTSPELISQAKYPDLKKWMFNKKEGNEWMPL